MRAWKIWLIGTICAAVLSRPARLPAQTAVSGPQITPPGQGSPQMDRRSGNPDAALEIPPRGAPQAVPSEDSPPSAPIEAGGLGIDTEPELPPVPASGPPRSMINTSPHQRLPYLGLAVQRIESHSTPGRDVVGLEIVSVDPGSPAERAGLKGRGPMTRLGASGATAGALMAPLDIALMPLLKRAGQLGHTGDLIVAIDGRRIMGEVDLETALAESKPGDTIYLTIVRQGAGSARKTTMIPVKLGDAGNS